VHVVIVQTGNERPAVPVDHVLSGFGPQPGLDRQDRVRPDADI
jgi:hypothetical protein